ncbi:MAG: YIP1 family protein [Planctomycetes bacterium]|nr:YIP1 family protein [Planctomycetota bacterium]
MSKRVNTVLYRTPDRRMHGMMTSVAAELQRSRLRPVGVWDLPLVFLAPRRLFARVEDVATYGWPMVLLLAAMMVIGFATVETGLIDLEVARGVQRDIAAFEKQQPDIVERSALRQFIEDKQKEGQFLRLMKRVQVVVARPAATLASILLVAALLYGVVALTGRKPEWHTLITLCVFASFVDLFGALVRLGFMLHFRTLDVDLSLARVVRLMDIEGEGAATSGAALSGLLSAVDPFGIWFWLVLILGLSVTAQLRGWKVWATCCFFWLAAVGVRTILAVALVSGPTPT